MLDDISKIEEIDADHMYKAMENPHSQLVESYRNNIDIAGRFSRSLEYTPSKVVLMGMGSSGLAADLARDWLESLSKTPISVLKSFDLPDSIGEDALFIAVSASGEASETLRATLEALDRRCRIACVASGGSLAETSKRHGLAYFPIVESPYSRTATFKLVGAIAALLERAIDVPSVGEHLESASRDLSSMYEKVSLAKPTAKNHVKRWALSNKGKDVHVLSTPRLRTVGLRLVEQFNENCKMGVDLASIPNALHNFVQQFGVDGDDSLILIRGEGEAGFVSKAVEEVRDVLSDKVALSVEVVGIGDNVLSELLTALLQVDYLSYYSAILKGVRPGPTPTMEVLKRRLKTLILGEGVASAEK